MEEDDTEESDTDNSINIITEVKHATDQKDHNTKAAKIDGTEKEINVNTGSPVTSVTQFHQIKKE